MRRVTIRGEKEAVYDKKKEAEGGEMGGGGKV